MTTTEAKRQEHTAAIIDTFGPPPLTADELADASIGEVIGFQTITDPGPRCLDGCLAPGSSPHSHAILTGWRFIGTDGILETDLDGMGMAIRTVHPFPVGS